MKMKRLFAILLLLSLCLCAFPACTEQPVEIPSEKNADPSGAEETPSASEPASEPDTPSEPAVTSETETDSALVGKWVADINLAKIADKNLENPGEDIVELMVIFKDFTIPFYLEFDETTLKMYADVTVLLPQLREPMGAYLGKNLQDVLDNITPVEKALMEKVGLDPENIDLDALSLFLVGKTFNDYMLDLIDKSTNLKDLDRSVRYRVKDGKLFGIDALEDNYFRYSMEDGKLVLEEHSALNAKVPEQAVLTLASLLPLTFRPVEE